MTWEKYLLWLKETGTDTKIEETIDSCSNETLKTTCYNSKIIDFVQNLGKEKFNKYVNLKPNSFTQEIIYDVNDDNYLFELKENSWDKLNYYVSSFGENKYGLERSQLLTFLYINDAFHKEGYNFFAINGGPGAGKSTITNYLISNYLFNHFWTSFQKSKKTRVSQFLTNYKLPRIALTGKTKVSIHNLEEICQTEPSLEHQWINKEEYPFIYKLGNEIDNKNKENDSYDRQSFKREIANIKKQFMEGFQKYFQSKEYWDKMPEVIMDKIKKNISQINEITKSINDISNKIQENIDNVLKKSNCEILINNFDAVIQKNYDKKQLLDNYINLILNSNKEEQNINIISLTQYLNNLKTNKFKRFFVSKKKIISKTEKKLKLYYQDMTNIKCTVNSSIKTLNTFLKNPLPLIDFEEIDPNIDMTIYSFDVVLKSEINKIQNTLDVNIRAENANLFRHILEWWAIENLSLLYIKPLDLGWLQVIVPEEQKYDLIIVDEASMIDEELGIYLNILGKKIIAIGDQKQINPFNSEKSILEELNTISNTNSIINGLRVKGFWLLEHFRCPFPIFKSCNHSFYNDKLIYKKQDNKNICAITDDILTSDAYNRTCDATAFIDIKYKVNSKANPNDNTNYQEIDIIFKFIKSNLDYILKHGNIANKENIDMQRQYLQDNLAIITFFNDQQKAIEDYIEEQCRLNPDDDFWKLFQDNKIVVGTVDKLQGLGKDFIICSNVKTSCKYIKHDKSTASKFSFNPNRINVLWSRTKKHFINIICDSFWNDYSGKNNTYQYIRHLIECDQLNNGITRIVLDEKNLDIKKCSDSLKKFSYDNNTYIQRIGFKGEENFDKFLNDTFIRTNLIKKMNSELSLNIPWNARIVWMNSQQENYLNYDFKIIDSKDNILYYIDLKSTTNTQNKKLFLSHSLSEQSIEFKQKYIIARMTNVFNFNIFIKNKETFSYLFANMNFYKLLDILANNEWKVIERKRIS